jgi:4-amino-4-deoxy-L-arabinose transferase-like glycosyltransferase
MKIIAKNKFWIILLPIFFISRFFNFKIIPIFTDEAIYAYWAQVALHDPANRFISLEDGKQPLFIWLGAIIHNFVSDPLVAVRMVSVLSGFASTIGIYLLAKTLFNEKTGRIAALLYIILPFTLLYDRMALFDSLLTVFGIYSLYFAVKIAQNPKLDLSLINGVVLGLGLITKSSANFFLYLLPLSLLFFNFEKENIKNRFFKWLGLTIMSVVIALIIFNLLRVSELFYLIARKNLEFIRSPHEVFKDPFMNFSGNFNSILTWFFQYNGPILMAVIFLAAVWGLYKRRKSVVLLLAYILAPFCAELLFNKVLYPRFALFYFPHMIIIAAFGLEKLLNLKKVYSFTILILALVYPAISSYLLLTNPPKSWITKADKNQYLNDWPAGYGVKEIVNFLNDKRADEKIYVGTEGTFGLLPYALQIYFYGREDIKIQGYWPVKEIPAQVLDAAKSQKTYFVFNETQSLSDNPSDPHLKFIAKYQKGLGNSYMRLYEIIP